MDRHLRLAVLVAIGFVLLVLSPIIGSLGGIGVLIGLILALIGGVLFVASGLLYTARFVQEFLGPRE